MTEIRFYHLTTRSIDQALPEVLQKAHNAGHRIVVRTRDAAETERLGQVLWTWKPESFLPHGSAKDGHAALQPIWLTPGNDVPNGARVLVVAATQDTAPVPGDDLVQFTLACDMFDGRDETQLTAARARWTAYKGTDHTLTYWQQGESGWEQKA